MDALHVTENEVQGLDFQALSTLRLSKSLSSSKTPTALEIAQNLPSTKNVHIPTQSLRVNGHCVQDKMETYLSHPYTPSSHLKKALVSPLHYHFNRSEVAKELEISKEKKHFKLGTFIHECFLEPTKFRRVVIEPKSSRSTKDGVYALIGFWKNVIMNQGFGINSQGDKIDPDQALTLAEEEVRIRNLDPQKIEGMKAKAEALEIISGCRGISEADYKVVQILKSQYESYGGGILPKIFTHAKREISFYSERDGIGLKVRPDAIQFEENIGCNAIISIKSTRCESIKEFTAQCAKLHYDLSEAMYQEVVSKVTGRDFNTTIMIMMQTVPPYGIAVLVWSGEDLETGRFKFNDAMHIIEQHASSAKGYEIFAEEGARGLIQLKLPAWNASIDPTS